jgi:hypothetical protein
LIQIVRRVRAAVMIVQPVAVVHHLVVRLRVVQVLDVQQLVAGLPIAIRVQVVHVAMTTDQVARAVSIQIVRRVRAAVMIVHQHVAVSVIAQIVRRVRATMMIVQPVAVVHHLVVHHLVAQVRVVRRLVVVLVIAIRVQVAHVVMMIVQVAHAVSMIVQRVRSRMLSVVPMKFVHVQAVVAMTAMQLRAMIISKSVGMTKVQHVHHVVVRGVVTTTRQFIWNVTRSVHQHQLLLT